MSNSRATAAECIWCIATGNRRLSIPSIFFIDGRLYDLLIFYATDCIARVSGTCRNEWLNFYEATPRGVPVHVTGRYITVSSVFYRHVRRVYLECEVKGKHSKNAGEMYYCNYWQHRPLRRVPMKLRRSSCSQSRLVTRLLLLLLRERELCEY